MVTDDGELSSSRMFGGTRYKYNDSICLRKNMIVTVEIEKHIHIHCGIKINIISMMNNSSVDMSSITFFLTASR